jgi:myo-inositol-hexaphosphate 3-phosphohydrolase
MLVVQDGSNDGEGSIRKQNFKFVSIKDVLDKIDE